MLKEQIQENFTKGISVLSFATFLSSNLYTTYAYITKYVGERIGYHTSLQVCSSLHEITEQQIHVAFLCGLLYVRMASQPSCPVELLAAPVLQNRRYQNKPIYYSDVIVRKESPYTSFDDLNKCVWAYNEKASHSGYNLVCYASIQQGRKSTYFGKTIETGSHAASLRMVLEGTADAAAIDSHMLDVTLHHNRELASQLRIIGMLGPSSIPPVVVSKGLSKSLKYKIQQALLTMHTDPQVASHLHNGLIDHFVPISDAHYHDIREMLALVQSTGFVL